MCWCQSAFNATQKSWRSWGENISPRKVREEGSISAVQKSNHRGFNEMSLIFWGRNLFDINLTSEVNQELTCLCRGQPVSYYHITTISKLSSLKEPSIIITPTSVGHLTADVAWARVILAERAHMPVPGEELCSSPGLFEAPDLVQICSKGPQPPPPGINRLALAHPSHGDDKKARRNMVGPLRPRPRIRKWLLVTST